MKNICTEYCWTIPFLIALIFWWLKKVKEWGDREEERLNEIDRQKRGING